MEKFNCDTFCERAKMLFGDSGQIELANAIGISQGMISAIKQKKLKSPGADIIFRIAQHFNVSTDWLLGLTDELNQDKAKLSAKARVELEIEDLKCKIKKIHKFILNQCKHDSPYKLNYAEMYFLNEQEKAMDAYMAILILRLSIWRDLDSEDTEK